MAMTAAETGHLVLGTLHTTGAVKTIDRIIDALPGELREQTKGFLAMSLKAVISQHLLPSTCGQKRELALEIMFTTSPIASAIRFGKIESIDNNILTGQGEGMLPLDESIERVISGPERKSRLISEEEK